MPHCIKRTGLSLILLFSILLSSCGGAAPAPADESAAPESTAPAETTDYLETLPAVDFGGRPFRILVYSANDRPGVHAGELTGEIVNDTLFSRDAELEERFGTEIVYTENGERRSLAETLIRLVQAGEDAYELVETCPQEGINMLILNGALCDLGSLDALALDREWWCQSMNSAVTFGGKTYAAAGPLVLCYTYSIYSMYENLTLADDYGLESLYDVIRDGKWTLDRLEKLTADVSRDLNGDSQMTVDDQWALTTTDESGKAFYLGCGADMMVNTQNGVEICLNRSREIGILDRLNRILKGGGVLYTEKLGKNAAGVTMKVAMFTESKALFCAAPIQWGVLYFRDMKDDYAILPYPKYDEAQDSYYSHINSFLPSCIGIPVTCSEPEKCAALIEAMAYLSGTELVPKINGVVLKEKIARDEDSKEMLDYLYSNVKIDLNTIFDFGGTGSLLRTYAIGQSENFASSLASVESVVESGIAAMLKAVAENQ